MGMLTAVTALIVGWILWTLTEYVVHRFSFHRHSSTAVARIVAAEHTRHHRDPAHTNLALRLAGHLGITVAGAPVGLTLMWLTTPTVGLAAWLGWSGGYIAYEISHWRMHHLAPRTARGLARRRHHLAHHAMSASMNFGVTVRWWDLVFGTSTTPTSVRIPVPVAPRWLLDDPSRYETFDLVPRAA